MNYIFRALAVALISWAVEARYGDMMELVLYNSVLSGVGVQGTDFYYNNPLRRWGDELPRVIRTQDAALRSAVLPCHCCPANLARTLAGLHDWAYAKSDGTSTGIASADMDASATHGRVIFSVTATTIPRIPPVAATGMGFRFAS